MLITSYNEKISYRIVKYFIVYSMHRAYCTYEFEFYLNTLLMNKVGECYLPSIVCTQYFSIIFGEKSGHSILNKIG